MGKLRSKFLNADGTINGKILAGTISLIIVLVQQILALYGIKFTGDWNAIVATINTILLILGTVGVLEQPTEVSIDNRGNNNEISQ